jgi:hypothetical protein
MYRGSQEKEHKDVLQVLMAPEHSFNPQVVVHIYMLNLGLVTEKF